MTEPKKPEGDDSHLQETMLPASEHRAATLAELSIAKLLKPLLDMLDSSQTLYVDTDTIASKFPKFLDGADLAGIAAKHGLLNGHQCGHRRWRLARELIDASMQGVGGLSQVYLIVTGGWKQPSEPIRLLKVAAETFSSRRRRYLGPGDPKPIEGMEFPVLEMVIDPGEHVELLHGLLPMPEGWDLDHAARFLKGDDFAHLDLDLLCIQHRTCGEINSFSEDGPGWKASIFHDGKAIEVPLEHVLSSPVTS